MFRRNLIVVWIGLILLSGMFLIGQESWPPSCHETVDIPDPNLEELIRQYIGKPEGDICAIDLLGLDRLFYEGRFNPIIDLDGLEHCKFMYSLSLGFNNISDLSPLVELKLLTKLSLYYNQVSDLSPLADLNFLTQLSLSRYNITDLSPLADLSLLAFLELEDNQISDILPLVNNPGIGSDDFVNLLGNPLSSTSCTTHVPALESRGERVDHECP